MEINLQAPVSTPSTATVSPCSAPPREKSHLVSPIKPKRVHPSSQGMKPGIPQGFSKLSPAAESLYNQRVRQFCVQERRRIAALIEQSSSGTFEHPLDSADVFAEWPECQDTGREANKTIPPTSRYAAEESYREGDDDCDPLPLNSPPQPMEAFACKAPRGSNGPFDPYDYESL